MLGTNLFKLFIYIYICNPFRYGWWPPGCGPERRFGRGIRAKPSDARAKKNPFRYSSNIHFYQQYSSQTLRFMVDILTALTFAEAMDGPDPTQEEKLCKYWISRCQWNLSSRTASIASRRTSSKKQVLFFFVILVPLLFFFSFFHSFFCSSFFGFCNNL